MSEMGDPERLRAKGRLNTFKHRKRAKFLMEKNVFAEKNLYQIQFLFLRFLKFCMLFEKKFLSCT